MLEDLEARAWVCVYSWQLAQQRLEKYPLKAKSEATGSIHAQPQGDLKSTGERKRKQRRGIAQF